MRPLNQLPPELYDIVVWPAEVPEDRDVVAPPVEEEPQAQGACGSFADGEGAPTPRPSRIQLRAPVQEQKASIPMWQAAFTDGALGA